MLKQKQLVVHPVIAFGPGSFIGQLSGKNLIPQHITYGSILQCEAGSSYEGMIAVGTVIMNRIASSRFPDTLKEVVYQPGQFGPAMTGKLDRVLAQ